MVPMDLTCRSAEKITFLRDTADLNVVLHGISVT